MYAGGGGRVAFAISLSLRHDLHSGAPAMYSGEDRSLEYIDTPLCRVHKIAFTFY